jgi:hypothetical protein
MTAAHTAGFILAINWMEFLVRSFGFNIVINLGFLLLTCSSFALVDCTNDR